MLANKQISPPTTVYGKTFFLLIPAFAEGNTNKAGSAGKPVGEPSKSIAHIKSVLQNILCAIRQ
jgi:hypothetical protein